MGVADDAEGIPSALNAAGELRVVGQDGTDTYHNGPVAASLGVDVAAGFLAGDPLGLPCVGGQLSVQGHGVLQDHIGGLGPDVVEEHVVEGGAGFFQHVFRDVHPGGPEDVQALARHLGIGVAGAHHHPGNARLQDGVGAGGLAAVVTAGLQGHVHGGAPGIFGAGGQGGPLRVEIAAFGVVPLGDDPAVLHHDGPHHGVGAGPAPAFLGQV